MVTAGIIFKAVIGSFWGRAMAMVAAGLLALGLNNMYQRAKGREQVVQASQKAGEKRNEAAAKIRDRIDPSTAWKRLREEYSYRQ